MKSQEERCHQVLELGVGSLITPVSFAKRPCTRSIELLGRYAVAEYCRAESRGGVTKNALCG
jgi:hypothetical protein